jgi:hypothetical protein
MPLFFYLEPEINDDPYLANTKEIKIVYKFYYAKKQDLADWMRKQEQWEFEQKAFLREKRKEKLVKEGKSIDQLVAEEKTDQMYMESSMPDYKLGSMKPNEITDFEKSKGISEEW